MTDRITFNCTTCGATIMVDESNMPGDDEMFHCSGCGREIGKFGVVKAAMIEAGKSEIDKLVEGAFGKKPDWR